MNRLLTAAFALSLLGGAAANAQPQPQDDHQGRPAGVRPPPSAPSAPQPRLGAGHPQQGQAAPQGRGPGGGPQGERGPGGGAPPQGNRGPGGPGGNPGPSQGYRSQGGPGAQQGYRGPGGPGGAPQGDRGPGFRGAPVQGGREWRAPHPVRGRPYYFPQGFGYRVWSFGEYLPGAFFGAQYALYDYYNYGLPQPPPGFEWVRVGPDALLVRPADGYILDAARGLFF